MNSIDLRSGPRARFLSCALLFAAAASAQNWSLDHLAFSITSRSANVGNLDYLGVGPIGPGDVLTCPAALPGSNPPAGFLFRRPLLGPLAAPRLVGPLRDRTNTQEVDALSYIGFTRWARVMSGTDYRWLFSVDRASLGTSKGDIPIESSVNQHAADVYRAICPTLLMGPTAPSVGCNLELDADGLFRNAPMLGIGLRDLPQRSDDLDALAKVPPVNRLLSFHSLSTRDALAIGISGADVHWYNPQAFPDPNNTTFAVGTRLYVAAAGLGLQTTDDVDALVVFENFFTNYQPVGGNVDPAGIATNGSGFFVHWGVEPNPTTYGPDAIYFSVTRTSRIVGVPDSRFGQPIQPGDILEPPAFGSPAGTPPRIVVMAELIGLRTDRLAPFDLNQMDDLDALEYTED